MAVNTLGSFRIVTNPHMVVRDWSDCRSPSRAKRRLLRGFRQRVKISPDPNAIQMGGTLVMHPETLRVVEREMARHNETFR